MGRHYRPDEQLREDEICREFNVTQTPVRLALRRLEQEKSLINCAPRNSKANYVAATSEVFGK